MINIKEQGNPDKEITLAAIYVRDDWEFGCYKNGVWYMWCHREYDYEEQLKGEVTFYVELPCWPK